MEDESLDTIGVCSSEDRGRLSSTLGWLDPPSHLELLQVFYVLRHGERTPVRRRLTTAEPPLPKRWNMCHTSHKFRQAVLRQSEEDMDSVEPGLARIQRRIEYAPHGESPHVGSSGDCLLGELTDRGRMSMLRIGQALRARYVEAEHLLPSIMSDEHANQVYFRSTYVNRTMQSLDQVIVGLLGDKVGQEGRFTPKVLLRDPFQEDLVPNSRTCPQLAALMTKFEKAAAQFYDPKLAALDSIVAPMDRGFLPRLDQGPKLSGLIDTLRSALVHGISVPPELQEQSVQRLMEDAVIAEWFGGYESSDLEERRKFRRMAMGPFLSSLYGQMERRVTLGDCDPLRLGLYLGHDVTLVGLLHTLDVFNRNWPAFSAGISFELFRDKNASTIAHRDQISDHYVRCRYGDAELHLPGCSAAGKHLPGHPEFCTLEAFREVVVDRLENPQGLTLQEECGAF
ncbi:phosphatase [Malassezia pachydermatis]|uniref:Phosphoglycerate mutase-like protein n=1 Tax=Malassezia pachydermatis TaxID=77020 RepID=A0A0M8MLF8_9BASI|nr:phosphoglycerate mutase-like protein [Malassezia pachydermatis]KOS13938.1 phosphoglycerate mutase-like protein [Malassezia pachydermatis]